MRGMDYILNPVSFDLNVKISQNHQEVSEGKIIIDCLCKQISMCLNENQYGQIVHLAEFFRNYTKSIKVKTPALIVKFASNHNRSIFIIDHRKIFNRIP